MTSKRPVTHPALQRAYSTHQPPGTPRAEALTGRCRCGGLLSEDGKGCHWHTAVQAKAIQRHLDQARDAYRAAYADDSDQTIPPASASAPSAAPQDSGVSQCPDAADRRTAVRMEAQQVVLNAWRARQDIEDSPGGHSCAFVDALADAGLLRDDPCTCGTTYATYEGPEETCPQHGRPYSYWLDRGDELGAQVDSLTGERDRARQLAADLESELATFKRGGETLGQIIEQQCRMALDATGLHDWIDEDGDGDWGAVWENLLELKPRAEQAEAERDEVAGRLSELLCDLTGGRLSKPTYSVATMVQEIEERLSEYADEDLRNERDDLTRERDDLLAERDDLLAMKARVEALADEWATQATDYDVDTEQQIADGKTLRDTIRADR